MSGKYLSRDAVLQTQKQQRRRANTALIISRWLVGLLTAALILVNLFTHVLQIVRYNGDGMEPNLSSGQTLVLLKTTNVSEGDIIAFYYNNQVLVRRVICLGGKQLDIETDGTVKINSAALEEPYLTEKSIGQCTISLPLHVRADTVFVMGDNRAAAMDSRLAEIGTIPEERIIGKVLFKI